MRLQSGRAWSCCHRHESLFPHALGLRHTFFSLSANLCSVCSTPSPLSLPAQAAAVAAAQAAGLPLPPGAVTGVTGAPGMPPGMAPPGGPGAPGTDPNNPQQQQQRVNKRMQAFGSSSNVLNKQLVSQVRMHRRITKRSPSICVFVCVRSCFNLRLAVFFYAWGLEFGCLALKQSLCGGGSTGVIGTCQLMLSARKSACGHATATSPAYQALTLAAPSRRSLPPLPPAAPSRPAPALPSPRQDPRTPGSILFTYVQTDEFCDSQELGRAVTTSPYEEENLLVRGWEGGREGGRES